MKKKDGIIIGVVLALAFVFAIWFYGGSKDTGSLVRITIDGKEYGEYSLFQEQEIEISNEQGYNRCLISGGRVVMEEADCPDGYCVEHKPIRNRKESIVCLPHKLVIEITGEVQADGIDSITQ